MMMMTMIYVWVSLPQGSLRKIVGGFVGVESRGTCRKKIIFTRKVSKVNVAQWATNMRIWNVAVIEVGVFQETFHDKKWITDPQSFHSSLKQVLHTKNIRKVVKQIIQTYEYAGFPKLVAYI